MGSVRPDRNGVAAAMAGALLLLATAGLPAIAADSPGQPPSAALRASALFAWHLSPSLANLRSEINNRWPGRDRSSDGAIGDLRHQSRTNSHNPVGYPGGPSFGTRGAVHALDITAAGIDVDRVLRAVIGDPRVWYVIHDGKIWSRTTGWAPRTYRGDPHTTHIHINLREDSQSAALFAETDQDPWLASGSGRGSAAQIGRSVPTAGTGMSASATKALQRALIDAGFQIPSGATGWYGPETTRAVKEFQKAQGWTGSEADGVAGAETLRRLRIGLSGGGSSAPAPKADPAAKPSPAKGTSATGRTLSTANLKPGIAHPDVLVLQQALIARGFPIPAGATGYYGARTTAAVKAFQKAQGWTGTAADGIPGSGTLKRLGLSSTKAASGTKSAPAKARKSAAPTRKSAAPTPAKASSGKGRTLSTANLKPGIAHPDVFVLQQALIAQGFPIPAGASGYYGARTTAAVKEFQKAQGWTGTAADGIPGSGTLKRLGL